MTRRGRKRRLVENEYWKLILERGAHRRGVPANRHRPQDRVSVAR